VFIATNCNNLTEMRLLKNYIRRARNSVQIIQYSVATFSPQFTPIFAETSALIEQSLCIHADFFLVDFQFGGCC